MVLFEQIVPLTFNEFSKNLVLGIGAFPSFVSRIGCFFYNRVSAIYVSKNVSNCAYQCHSGRPMDTPALEISLFLKHQQGKTTVVEHFPSFMRHD